MATKPHRSKRQKSKFFLSTKNLLITITFLGIFTMATRVSTTPDTWWHLRTGQYIFENWTLPTTDIFSHTKFGAAWINHSWLAQIFWYSLFSVGGWGALALGVASLVTIAFYFVWKQIEANLFIATFTMILGAVVSAVVWVARPQLISFTLTAVAAYQLHRFKRHDRKLLPWLPLVMLVWANIHGGFAIGFMLMLAYLVGEIVNQLTGHQDDQVVSWAKLRQLLIVILISLAVVALNPYGWRMWLYPFQTVGIGALRDFIQEWQSPNFHTRDVYPFLLMLLFVMVALGRSQRLADWTDLALIALWTGWSLFAGRNIGLFALVVTPILARYADSVWTQQWQAWGYKRVPFAVERTYQNRFTLVFNWVFLLILLGAALVKIALPLQPEINLQVEQSRQPYKAVEFIKMEQPPGPIFNSYNWGGYLIFKLSPDYPVYIDGRTDLYDDVFIRRYLGVMVADDDWRDVMDEDGINTIFIEQNSILAKFLRRDADWQEVYQDNMAAIFVRESELQ